ncbi:hypothetical protein A3Q56_03852 [Intoshia linei]|uniref:Mitochondrial import inner membrane translocase subunit TIM50 n=1 Tax=Intoshia linei TaxID=1819745 RepID=A0A177B2B5_9BILA|nr:hypothetical protein A3Q56_03852 [Intoshia linei]
MNYQHFCNFYEELKECENNEIDIENPFHLCSFQNQQYKIEYYKSDVISKSISFVYQNIYGAHMDECNLNNENGLKKNTSFRFGLYIDLFKLYYIKMRPHLVEFLETMSRMYKLVLFTASSKSYADVIIKKFDQDNKFFKKRFYRDSCQIIMGIHVKDLNILPINLNNVIIIDDVLQAVSVQNSLNVFQDFLNNTQSWDNDNLFLAETLLGKLNDFTFVFFLNCFDDILSNAGILFDILQMKKLNMKFGQSKIKEFVKFVEALRTDEHF